MNILICTQAIVPSTHIRLISPLNVLARRGQATWRLLGENELDPLTMREADVLIIQRSTSPVIAGAIRAARSLGIPVIYECDDNFLAIERDVAGVGEYYTHPFVQHTFRQMLGAADVVTVSTPVLADAFRPMARDVRLLPNCVDVEQIDAVQPRDHGSDVVIGYAGSVTHNRDFEAVWPALERILAEFPEVRLDFLGFVPAQLQGRDRVSFVPYSDDYPGFLRTLGSAGWAIGLAPLADEPFNHGKTDNKFREYGACRIPGVYSDLPVYSASVTQGETGILVPHDPDGWYDGLRAMLTDHDLRERVRENARAAVEVRYSCERSADAWLTLLDEVTRTTPSSS